MIFDIYEQADLYKIAHCRQQSGLTNWLKSMRIPFGYDARGKVIAHRKAVERALGVADIPLPQKEQVVLALD